MESDFRWTYRVVELNWIAIPWNSGDGRPITLQHPYATGSGRTMVVLGRFPSNAETTRPCQSCGIWLPTELVGEGYRPSSGDPEGLADGGFGVRLRRFYTLYQKPRRRIPR